MKSQDENLLTILVEESGGHSRFNEPVTFGIPFPKGMVADSQLLTLWDVTGRQCPLQATALAKWVDGSVKWAILDFQATVQARERAVYRVCPSVKRSTELGLSTLSVQESADQIIVNTGKAQFFVNRYLCNPFDRVVIGQADVLATQRSSFELTDEAGMMYLHHIDDLAIEAKGPMRLTIRARGSMQSSARKHFARFVARLSFFYGSGLVEFKTTLHNPRAARHPGGLWDLGDENSVYFKDLSLRVPLQARENPVVGWIAEPHQPLKQEAAVKVEIYQDSSGGENWRSTNHVNRFGQVMQSFRGYRVTVGDALVEEGLRATPTVSIRAKNGGISGAIEKFWQNFPKAIEVDGNQLTLRLFPRQYNDLFELQGGEQKTHTVYLQFYGPGEKQPDLSWVHGRLVPRATPEWYAKTKACSYLSPRAEDHNTECLHLIDSAIEGPQSFVARREIIDEYGWRHFGDLYADHEAVGHDAATPLIAHYNNQYDVIYGALVQYLRSGDKRWFELAFDLARHVIDIDVYHTQEDRPAYNGGLFWHTDHYLDAGTATHRAYSKASLNTKDGRFYGGGPANEHNYTSGLLLLYYLTGDETARDTVLSLADWVINMDDGSRRFCGWLDKRPTGLCSASATWEYHGPGRGAGNSLNALIDAYSLTHEQCYLTKAEEIIRRCIHPRDDFEARCLDNIEHHWSYLVFLQALGKYLDCKTQKSEIDRMYQYARASLLHYADWMLSHEVPYATVLDKVEIPTETWPAQDIRKSVVFHMVAKYVEGPLRETFRERASFFFQTCVTDLRSFPTCALTRPLALLLSNAHVHSYFEKHSEAPAPQATESYDFGRPQRFSSQFAQLYWARQKVAYLLRSVTEKGRLIGRLVRKKQSSWGMDSG
jgi:hypothetical protein